MWIFMIGLPIDTFAGLILGTIMAFKGVSK